MAHRLNDASHRREQSLPLVSCIMPTANRRRFVPLAIRYFLAQDYPNKELVILDDGDDPVADLIPGDPHIRYFRLTGRRALGRKRNECVEASHGDVILHWDDDDWYAPYRISYQVDCLRSGHADICGLNHVHFYDPGRNRAWVYRFETSGKPWVYGCTLAYTRAFWQGHPFANLDVGEDTRFVWSGSRGRVETLQDNRFCVALIHPHNTSPKQTSNSYWRAASVALIEELMGPDRAAYRPPAQAEQADSVVVPPLSSNVERTLPMLTVARESDLSMPEFAAFNHGQQLPRMRRWEMPFALFQARLANSGSVLDCTINPVNFRERLAELYPHVQYHHWNPIQNGQFAPPVGMPDESFDRVFCINTLEHLLASQRDVLIAAISRKLKPGGLLILTSDYYFDHFWEQPEFLNAGVMRQDRQEIFNGWNKVTPQDWVSLCKKHDLSPLDRALAEPDHADPSLYRQSEPFPHATIGGVFYKGARRPRVAGRKIVLALLSWNTCTITMESVHAYLREAHMLERLGQEVALCICDNGSTDGTQDALRALEPHIDVTCRLILNDENRGICVARNQIIDFALETDAAYLLLMDGDIEIVPFSSFAMLRHMENSGSQLGCIGPDHALQSQDRARTARALFAIRPSSIRATNLVACTQYGMFRCDMFKDGVRFDSAHPFDGPGWGFEDNDLAFQMDIRGFVNQQFIGTTYLHRAVHSSIKILKDNGYDAGKLCELRKQYVVNKWAATPRINDGPLAVVRRIVMHI